jgi:aryl-alcohol dehydrogenase-like predicted oxidoreductase
MWATDRRVSRGTRRLFEDALGRVSHLSCRRIARGFRGRAARRRLRRRGQADHPAQLALAWLLEQGEDILPIPGTASIAHLEQNVAAASVRLAADELANIAGAFPPGVAAGDRYTYMSLLNR